MDDDEFLGVLLTVLGALAVMLVLFAIIAEEPTGDGGSKEFNQACSYARGTIHGDACVVDGKVIFLDRGQP